MVMAYVMVWGTPIPKPYILLDFGKGADDCPLPTRKSDNAALSALESQRGFIDSNNSFTNHLALSDQNHGAVSSANRNIPFGGPGWESHRMLSSIILWLSGTVVYPLVSLKLALDLFL